MAVMHRHLVDRHMSVEVWRRGNRLFAFIAIIILAISLNDLRHISLTLVRVVARIRVGRIADGLAQHILWFPNGDERSTVLIIDDLELIAQNPFQDRETGQVPRLCFFKQPVLKHLLGKGFLEIMRLRTQRLHLITGGRARRVSSKTFLACFQEFLRQTVVQTFSDAFLAAQRSDTLLAPRPRQHDLDLLFRG
jgi:hypothetical protein